MAATPLENSSTPPRAISLDPTRPHSDSMEDIHPESTRKRPRLDSGSGACESLSTDRPETAGSRMSEQGEAAPAVSEQEASASNATANRVTINMKSPTSADMVPESVDTSPDQPAAATSVQSPDVDANASTAISLSSSPGQSPPVQSPEIEVAEVEDMDQDPNASNWKPLGETLRVGDTPEVVQLHSQLPLADTFPSLHSHLEPRLRPRLEPRENLEEVGSAIFKGMGDSHGLSVKLFSN